MMCVDTTGKYIAVPSEFMCEKKQWPCLKSLESVEANGICGDELETFLCSNNVRITRTLTCNYEDDCKTLTDNGKLPLYEDEANCNHMHGVRCEYNSTTRGQIVVWVPPYRLCQLEIEDAICDDQVDQKYDISGSLSSHCELGIICRDSSLHKFDMMRTVYVSQMCDPTGYKYCDLYDITYIDCNTHTNADVGLATDIGISCDYHTENETTRYVSIDKVLECDGSVTCDDGEDEKCVLIRKQNTTRETCTKNAIRIGEMAHDGCYLNSSYEYVTCPRDNANVNGDNQNYHIQMELLCDGYKHCKHKNEEMRCPGFQDFKEPFYKIETSDHTTMYFEPQCVPGIKLISSRCEQRLYYVEESLNCQAGVTSCKTVYNVSYCVPTIYGYMKCGPSEKGNSTEIIMADSLTIFVDVDRGHDYGFFRCRGNNFTIPVTKKCDTIIDCVDLSDEEFCEGTNLTFDCAHLDQEVHRRFIPASQVCDGTTNCLNSWDECNEECPSDSTRNILTRKYIPIAGIIGITATLVNLVSISKHIKDAKSVRMTNSFINHSLISLIAVGDLLVGLYMICIVIATLLYGHEYCRRKYEWLSSHYCSALGVLSTTGTLTSMLSMTTLSIFRMFSLKSMASSGEVSASKVLKVTMMCITILTLAMIISVAPLIESLESYFVNGLLMNNNPFFTDVAKRSDIKLIVNYFDELVDTKLEDSSSWKSYERALKSLYLVGPQSANTTQSYLGKRVGFYGNQGVCLFKYFVTLYDPQMGYSLSVIVLSGFCFVLITCCYVIILSHATSSSKSSGSTDVQKTSMNRLQRKITLIILTDFLTWIPFIMISILHLAEVFDATTWYEFCSILLIPINSVINPIIYNGDQVIATIKTFITRRMKVTNEIQIEMISSPKDPIRTAMANKTVSIVNEKDS